MKAQTFTTGVIDKNNCVSTATNRQAFDRSAIQALEANAAIEQVFQYYRLTFNNSPSLQAFVKTSTRIPTKLKSASLIGASNRSLGLQIPVGRKVSGGATRGLLKRVGLLTTTGGEYFRGCIVFAHQNANHQITSATGIRFSNRLRAHEKVMITWQLPSPDEYKRHAIERAKENFNEKTH